MRKTALGITLLFAVGGGISAQSFELTRVSAEPDAAAERAGPQIEAQKNVADASSDCRKVDVVLDEGYGVTGHATRNECGGKQR